MKALRSTQLALLWHPQEQPANVHIPHREWVLQDVAWRSPWRLSGQHPLRVLQPSRLTQACTWHRNPPACSPAHAPAAAALLQPLHCSQTCMTALHVYLASYTLAAILLPISLYLLTCWWRLAGSTAYVAAGNVRLPCKVRGAPVIHCRVHQEALSTRAVLAAALEGAPERRRQRLRVITS